MESKRYELMIEYPGSPAQGTIVSWDKQLELYIDEEGSFSFEPYIVEEHNRYWKDADRDKRTMAQKMDDFLNSEEGQKAADRYFEELEKEEIQAQRDYERVLGMITDLGITEFVYKVMHKYESDEYIKREMKMGYQPREPLKDYILKYFEDYGEETQEYANDFMECNYNIENIYVGIMHGQGSYIKIQIID